MDNHHVGFICPFCGHVNRPGEPACAQCGKPLDAGRETQTVSGLENLAVERTGKAFVSGQRPLVLHIEQDKVIVQLRESVTVGRTDESGKETPFHVDLTTFGAETKGVSRRHVKLTLDKDLIYVTDLGSKNGTRLNGSILIPNSARLLRDGDELQLGSLTMKISFNPTEEVNVDG